MTSPIRFRILLIDDDYEMNTRLEGLLNGCRISISGIQVVPEVDRVDVAMEERSDKPGFWKIRESTLQRIDLLSKTPTYNLVIADFGFVPRQVQEALWGKDSTLTPTKEEVRGKVLNIRDLRSEFEEWSNHSEQGPKRKNVFTSARRVVLRSFGSRLGFDIFGPVVPTRSRVTQATFPAAEIVTMDLRQEFFGNDEFYEIYERPDGRDFYRHLVGTYTMRLLESEMLRHITAYSRQIRVRRSVFNIAAFAGAVAVIGGVVQYLSNSGFQLLGQGRSVGWLFVAAGLVSLVLGALFLSLTFEWFARTVVRWIGPEDEFGSD
jgi:hypothetical protein